MQRIHLFEFEDQPWFPSVIRGYMTDYLNFAASMNAKPFESFSKKLKSAMQKTGDREILDLCSGGGGPLPQILKFLREKEKFPVQATLSDYYPNLTAFEKISKLDPNIKFNSQSVDATSVPSQLNGFRLLMNSFHHFSPTMAQKILEDAVKAKKGIAVLELVSRSFFGFFSVATLLIGMPLLTPFIRPFKVSRLVFTYIFPVVPLFALWDGIVSCLRVYSETDLKELLKSLNSNDFDWEVGKLQIEQTPAFVTYLIGVPKS